MSPLLSSPCVSILTAAPRKSLLFKQFIELRSPRTIFNNFFNYACGGFYGGHYSVTKSLINGLRQQGYAFNYNPSSHRLHKTCIVLSGIDALIYAVEQKKIGKIDRLIAGPNVITVPSEVNGLIASPEVDVCLVPSSWVKDLYIAVSPELTDRLIVWPAGVDADFWKSEISDQKTGDVDKRYLLYVKGHEGKRLVSAYIKEFDRIGISYDIITYGQYTTSQYKHLLSKSKLMIVLGGTESQGIALAEAWSMNVPTFIRSVNSWKSPSGFFYDAEAAPYLSSETGAYFSDLPELLALLMAINSAELKYSPRAWVLNHMTDRVCAQALTEQIQKIGI
jgi:hypothetical protein